MTNGERILTIPRHNPVNAFTMAGIIRDAGLSIDHFAICFEAMLDAFGSVEGMAINI